MIKFKIYPSEEGAGLPEITSQQVIEQMGISLYKEQVQRKRRPLKAGSGNEAKELNGKLPAITSSIVFNKGHKAGDGKVYALGIITDFDGMDGHIVTYKEKLKVIPYIQSRSIRSSDKGTKIAIPINNGMDEHEKMYETDNCFYKEVLDVPIHQTSKKTRVIFLIFTRILTKGNSLKLIRYGRML